MRRALCLLHIWSLSPVGTKGTATAWGFCDSRSPVARSVRKRTLFFVWQLGNLLLQHAIPVGLTPSKPTLYGTHLLLIPPGDWGLNACGGMCWGCCPRAAIQTTALLRVAHGKANDPALILMSGPLVQIRPTTCSSSLPVKT